MDQANDDDGKSSAMKGDACAKFGGNSIHSVSLVKLFTFCLNSIETHSLRLNSASAIGKMVRL